MNASENHESFQTTHWSMILMAREGDVSCCREAMQELCGRYWFPLYAFTRRRGYQSHQAQDLIQAFFLRVLEKDVLSKADRDRGRFRNFLLASLKNFLANETAKAESLRRGGRQPIVSLDFRDAEGRLAQEAIDHLTPEAHYHRQWALQVLHRTLDQLRDEFSVAGKTDLFDHLQPYLSVDSRQKSYAETAADLGMTPNSVKVAVHRLRQRYRRRLESEIADTIASREQIEEEIQDLMRALGTAGS